MTTRPCRRVAHSPNVASGRIGQNCGRWPARRWGSWLSVSWLLVLVYFVLIIPDAAAQLKQTRRVLILNDLSIVSSPGFAEVDQAVLDGLKNSPYRIELYHDSLQVSFFPYEASQRRVRE